MKMVYGSQGGEASDAPNRRCYSPQDGCHQPQLPRGAASQRVVVAWREAAAELAGGTLARRDSCWPWRQAVKDRHFQPDMVCRRPQEIPSRKVKD